MPDPFAFYDGWKLASPPWLEEADDEDVCCLVCRMDTCVCFEDEDADG